MDLDPTFIPGGERIAWRSNRSGTSQIWIAQADGSGARQLTNLDFPVGAPCASTDGEWIVFESWDPARMGLWKIRVDGTGLAPLHSGSAGLPRVSPDGRFVSFLRHSDAQPTLATLRWLRFADGTVEPGEITLTPGAITDLLVPGRAEWTRGGALAYLDKDAAGLPGIFVRDLVAPGAAPRPLIGFEPDLLAETFAFSPDGRRVAISRLDMQQSLMMAEAIAPVGSER